MPKEIVSLFVFLQFLISQATLSSFKALVSNADLEVFEMMKLSEMIVKSMFSFYAKLWRYFIRFTVSKKKRKRKKDRLVLFVLI